MHLWSVFISTILTIQKQYPSFKDVTEKPKQIIKRHRTNRRLKTVLIIISEFQSFSKPETLTAKKTTYCNFKLQMIDSQRQ